MEAEYSSETLITTWKLQGALDQNTTILKTTDKRQARDTLH
jgi:hypothetical protein